MASHTDVFDLGALQLSSGDGRSIDLRVRVDPLEFGGQRYVPEPATMEARLDVSRMTSGYSLRMRYGVRLDGPCMRCLEAAGREVAVDAREVDQPGGGDEELTSPYVEGNELDIRAWARDALVLALPAQIVCRDECRGLCPVCGENLNEAGADHAHEEEPDPRWAKLRELRFE
jgi:uncharacterized protein